MPNDDVLTLKERALIALGASVAAGCRPCTTYQVKAARAAGACNRSVSLAIETAVAGRNSATASIHEWAERCQGDKPEIDAEFRTEKRLIVELASIAVAVAVNSAPGFERHLTAAREGGARPEQIQCAIDIARRIQRTAEEKLAASTGYPGGDAQPAATTGPQSKCCGTDHVGEPEVAAGTRSDCGCH